MCDFCHLNLYLYGWSHLLVNRSPADVVVVYGRREASYRPRISAPDGTLTCPSCYINLFPLSQFSVSILPVQLSPDKIQQFRL